MDNLMGASKTISSEETNDYKEASDNGLHGKLPFDSGPLADAGERKAIFVVLDSYR